MAKMGRPKEYENLRPVTVMVEGKIIDEAHLLGINISEICRNALSTVTRNPELKKLVELAEKFKRVPKLKMNKIRRLIALSVDKERAGSHWANWLKKEYDIDTTPEELNEFLLK